MISYYGLEYRIQNYLIGTSELDDSKIDTILDSKYGDEKIYTWILNNSILFNKSARFQKLYFKAVELNIKDSSVVSSDFIESSDIHSLCIAYNSVKNYLFPPENNYYFNTDAEIKKYAKDNFKITSLTTPLQIKKFEYCVEIGLLDKGYLKNLIVNCFYHKNDKIEFELNLIKIRKLAEKHYPKDFKSNAHNSDLNKAFNFFSNLNPDKESLFENIKPIEFYKILNADKNTTKIVSQLISENKWMDLFETYGMNSDLYHNFVAAYCDGEINEAEMATALQYHRLYYNDPKNFTLISINQNNFEKDLKKFNYDETDLKNWKKVIEDTPQNLRNYVVYRSELFDLNAILLIRGFTKEKTTIPGIMINTFQYGFLSFGLTQKYYESMHGIKLKAILHISRKCLTMVDRLLNYQSDYALFHPKEEILVHGNNNAIFAYMHDIYHTYHRSLRFFLLRDTMDKTKEIYDAKSKLKLPLYKAKIDNQAIHARFFKDPTENELFAFLVNEILKLLIDADYKFDELLCINRDASLKHVLDKCTNWIFHRTEVSLPSYDEIAKSLPPEQSEIFNAAKLKVINLLRSLEKTED